MIGSEPNQPPGDGATNGVRTLVDPLAEALRLIELAGERRMTVRLMGGLAFHAQAPEWRARTLREGRDIDLAIRGADRGRLIELLAVEGYTPDREYNALYGHKQLYFVDVPRRRPVDVLVDRLEMCHRFDFGGRLAFGSPTLPLAELLLSKLQIVKINRKDVLDALVLLAEHPLAEDDGTGASSDARAAINVRRITELTSSDWGLWRTVTHNLQRLRAFLEVELGPDDLDVGRPPRFDPAAQLNWLEEAIDVGEKSVRWRMRAAVGERIRWYEEPEEVRHGD